MKRRYDTKMTRKGQVTVPAEIRRKMNLQIGDRVSFVSDGDTVQIEPASSWVERTKGIFHRPGMPVLSDKELKEATQQAWTDEALERDERSKQR